MSCPSCHFQNPEGMKFCVECGASLMVRCGQCGTEMMPTYKFCGECGKPLGSDRNEAAPRAAAGEPKPPTLQPTEEPPAAVVGEGERKQISVLICSLEPVDPNDPPLTADEQHGLLSRFFARAQPQVERFGGTINRYLNQGFMALFGAPVAWEDHPQRAVLAALGIREQLASEHPDLATSRPQPGTPSSDVSGYQIRIGIDTGAVVVGGVGGMAVGEAVVRAGALQQLAAGGEILISARTGRWVRGQVALEEGASLKVDGATIETLKVRPQSEVDEFSLHEIDSLNPSPFVGREHELSVLEEASRLTGRQQGQVIGLVGEAGVGKSRLLREFFRRLRDDQEVSYLRGQCLSYGGGIPYLPLIDMIRKASRIRERDSAATVVDKVRRSLQKVGTEEASLPYLLRLLGVEDGTQALEGLEPQAVKTRTFAAMRRMLLDAGRHTLVVVEIEDLQWIDDTSAEFLDSLVEIMAAARVMVILTYRSGYQPRWLDKSFAHQMSVRRLTEDASRQLVTHLLTRSERTLQVDEDVLRKAEGNPLFLEELTRTLMDGDGDQQVVPETVQGILMARLDGLPDHHRRLLRTASVLGRTMHRDLLQVIWDEEVPMDPLLEDLQRWELIYKAPSEDRVSYVFHRALTQEVAYASLLEHRRQALHTRAAKALEERHAGNLEEVYHQLIYHYPKAGQPAKTVHYLTLFAARAAENYAHAEAAKALRQALEQVENLPAEEQQRRAVTLLLQLAQSLLPLAAFPETLELFETHLDDMEALDDDGIRGRYLFWLAHTYTYLGNQQATWDFAQRSIDAAQQAQDEATEGKACYVLGRDGFWSGQFSEGIRNSLRAIVLLERTGEAWWQGQAYWVAGFNHYALGQFNEAIEALQRCSSIGKALDDYRLDASWSLGYFHASLGNADRGIDYCEKGLEASQDPLNSAVSSGFLGYALLVRGDDLEQARNLLASAMERMRQAGMQQLEGWFSVYLGEALGRLGDGDSAREVLQVGLEQMQAVDFRYGIGLALRALGRVELAAGTTDTAGKHFAAGRLVCEELDVPFEIAKLHLEQAKLCRQQNAPEAAEHLKAAEAIFATLNVPEASQPTLRRAAELLADLV